MTKSEIKVGEVPVCVTRKGIKHMHLYVQPPDGRVVASVPEDASDESIQFFVRENFGWILREREAMRGQARQTPREYVSGETLYVWGEQKFLTVEKQNGWGGVKISGNEITLLAPEESTVKSRREYMTDWYRRLLTDAVGVFVLRVLALLFVIGGVLWLVGAVVRGTCSAILPNGTRCAG